MTAADPNTGQDHTQLVELAQPFPAKFIEGKAGNKYVAHHIINQRLLSVVGPFSFKLVEVLRGDVPTVAPNPEARSDRGKAGTPALSGIVVGGIWRLVVTIDGERVEVEEVGDVGDVHNWAHDGARLKDAASDALKRCAMRLGLALHLWAQEHYFLDQQLAAQFATPPQDQPTAAPQESEPGGASAPETRALDSAIADAAKAPDPSQGPVADGTPPDFDHLTDVEQIREWLKDHRELWPLIREDAAASGLDLQNAPVATLRELVVAAWRVQQEEAA